MVADLIDDPTKGKNYSAVTMESFLTWASAIDATFKPIVGIKKYYTFCGELSGKEAIMTGRAWLWAL